MVVVNEHKPMGGQTNNQMNSQDRLMKILEQSDKEVFQIMDEVYYRINGYKKYKKHVKDKEEIIAFDACIEELEKLLDFIRYRVMNRLP
jgi:hypothetical protein